MTTKITIEKLLDRVAKNGHCPDHRLMHLKNALARLRATRATSTHLNTLVVNLFFACQSKGKRTQLVPALVDLFNAYRSKFGGIGKEKMRQMLVTFLNHAERNEIIDPKEAIKNSNMNDADKKMALRIIDGLSVV